MPVNLHDQCKLLPRCTHVSTGTYTAWWRWAFGLCSPPQNSKYEEYWGKSLENPFSCLFLAFHLSVVRIDFILPPLFIIFLHSTQPLQPCRETFHRRPLYHKKSRVLNLLELGNFAPVFQALTWGCHLGDLSFPPVNSKIKLCALRDLSPVHSVALLDMSLHPHHASGLLWNICTWRWEATLLNSEPCRMDIPQKSTLSDTQAWTEMHAFAFRRIPIGFHVLFYIYLLFLSMSFCPIPSSSCGKRQDFGDTPVPT